MEDIKKQTGIGEVQVVVFSLANEEFGVEIDQIKEINRMTEVTQLPKAPDFIEGIINLRGRVVIVMDLAKRLDLPVKEPDEKSRIIMVEAGEIIVGMIVDSVSEALRFTTDKFEKTPKFFKSQVNAEFLRGIAKLSEKRLLLILDLFKVLSKEEYEALESVTRSSLLDSLTQES